MNDIKRPKQTVKRTVRRSNIALDEYMFERKMQSLYYGKKPKSDDLPRVIQWLRAAFSRLRYEFKRMPLTVPHAAKKTKQAALAHPAKFLAGSLLGFVLVTLVALQVTRQKHYSPAASQPVAKSSQTAGTNGSRIPTNQTPEFSVLLPEGKTAKDVGGFAKVSPTGAPSAYAYKDDIYGVSILVTQQQLAESFKTETSKQVEKLAIGFNATQSIKTEKAEFFVGTNTSGQQSVITYTKTLLILLKSDNKISNERWQTYIENLK